MKAMATAVREATTQSARATRPTSLISSEWIGGRLDVKGFRRAIAGEEDFGLASRAIAEAINTGRGLFITGGCGVGKTQLLHTLFSQFNYNGPKYWIDCSDENQTWLLDPRQNSRYKEMLDMYLFLDDLGTEVKVEYGRRTDCVAEFIRQYHSRGTHKLFISTNLNANQMLDTYDERIFDRIVQMCVILQMNGKSKRERMVAK